MKTPNALSRRTFLKATGQTSAGLALAVAGTQFLTACSSDEAAGKGGGGFGSLTYQLGWIKNVQWAGSYFADKLGYYKQEGFDNVDLAAGGPTAPPIEGVVSSGKALVGVSSPSATAEAILQGAKLKTVGAMYQHSPYCIISLTDNAIMTPRDMVGRKIGVPQNNQPTWNAFLELNGIDAGDIEVVPVGFNPNVLPEGQVEGLMAFVSNEPIQLELQGVSTKVMRFSDFNYAAVNNNYVVSEKALTENRDAIKAFLRGEIRGWQRALASAEESARITVEEYGSDLGLEMAAQVAQAEVQKTLMVTEETEANGLFTLSEALLESSVRVLNLTGVDGSAEQLVDVSLLSEIYDEDPALV